MKKILIVGSSPLPNEKKGIRTAYSLRTWQFVKPLLNTDDFDITLLTIDEKKSSGEVLKKENTKFTHYTAPKQEKILIKMLQKVMKEIQPEAVIAVNNYPSYVTSLVKNLPPFWADVNGWIMAEGHEQSKRDRNNDFLATLFHREKTIALSSDQLSTVSTPQKYALCGEITALGRTHKDFDPSLNIHVIPNATELFDIDTPKDNTPLFRGSIVPKEAFVVSFIGGYNTWVDEKTLFESLEEAIKQNNTIHFVSTGGELSAISPLPYKNFRTYIDNSPYKDHFHFLGWIETEDMSKVYKETDCGINVDHNCLETQTGARNRINEMLKFGLPVITTLGSEIAFDLQKHDAALTCNNKDSEYLTKHILTLASDHNICKKYSTKAIEYTTSITSYQTTTKPLIQWLKNPQKSSKTTINVHKKNTLHTGIAYIKKYGFKRFVQKLFRR